MLGLNMSRPVQIHYRRLSIIFLTAAGVMVILGETVLQNRLERAGLILFCLACFACTMFAILMALLDLAALQRRARQQQRELLENTFQEVVRQKEEELKFDQPDSQS
jgi:hypothetical protein